MKNFTKFAVLAILAVSATAASAAELEFHGYTRLGFGFNSAGGNQVAFMQSVSGKSKFRLGNEADACIEPGFTYSFTKLDDKSVWGVHLLPAFYRRMNGGTSGDGPFPVSYKEYYFYGQNVPQLGGGEIWVGRRYFGRNYLGAINDSFLEAQDGNGAGIYDIPVGPAKLSFDIAAPNAYQDSEQGLSVTDINMSIGAHVTNIPTFNKDSNLQVWARVYVPMQKKDAVDPAVVDGSGNTHAKRVVGYSVSAMHVAGFGSAGNLTVAGRFDQNGYTDQQDNGSGGKRNLEADVVYGVNVPSARTSIDAMVGWRQSKSVKQFDGQTAPADDTNNLIIAGFRTDTQISGPFRFLFELGYDTNKSKGTGQKTHTLVKVTPALAISGGNDPWSRPTFRLFYTFASWNKDGALDVMNAWKDSGAASAFLKGKGAPGGSATWTNDMFKTSGGSFGLQAEGWW